jgi:hypothetical protein
MYSMLALAEHRFPPGMLLLNLYGAFNYEILGFGKLRVCKQWPSSHQGLGVWLVHNGAIAPT